MKTILRLCTGVVAALVLCQCSATPQSRIERNPQIYSQLNSKDRQLAASGTVREGMTRDAVYLAWGRPDRVSMGTNRGRAIETWTYLGERPVSTFSMGFGSGFGRGPYWGGGPWGWGGWGYGGYGGGYWGGGPSVTYVPYTHGVVEFSNGRVTRWMTTPR